MRQVSPPAAIEGLELVRQFTFQVLLPNAIYGLFNRWIGEVNLKDSGNLPSGR